MGTPSWNNLAATNGKYAIAVPNSGGFAYLELTDSSHQAVEITNIVAVDPLSAGTGTGIFRFAYEGNRLYILTVSDNSAAKTIYCEIDIEYNYIDNPSSYPIDFTFECIIDSYSPTSSATRQSVHQHLFWVNDIVVDDPGGAQASMRGQSFQGAFKSKGETFKQWRVNDDASISFQNAANTWITVYTDANGWTDMAYAHMDYGTLDLQNVFWFDQDRWEFVTANTYGEDVNTEVVYTFNASHSGQNFTLALSTNVYIMGLVNTIIANGLVTRSSYSYSGYNITLGLTPASPYNEGEEYCCCTFSSYYASTIQTFNVILPLYVQHNVVSVSPTTWSIDATGYVELRGFYISVTHGTVTLSQSSIPSLNFGSNVNVGTPSWMESTNDRIYYYVNVSTSTPGSYSASVMGYVYILDDIYDLSGYTISLTAAKTANTIVFNDQTISTTWMAANIVTFNTAYTSDGATISYTLLSAVDASAQPVDVFTISPPYLYWNSGVTAQTYTLTIQADAAETSTHLPASKTVTITLNVNRATPSLSFYPGSKTMVCSADGSVAFAPAQTSSTAPIVYTITSILDGSSHAVTGAYFGIFNGRLYWGTEALGPTAHTMAAGESYSVFIKAEVAQTDTYASTFTVGTFSISFTSGATWSGSLPASIPYQVSTAVNATWPNGYGLGTLYSSDVTIINPSGTVLQGVNAGNALITIYWSNASYNIYDYATTKRITVDTVGAFTIDPSSIVVNTLSTTYETRITALTEPSAPVQLTWTSSNVSIYNTYTSEWVVGSDSSPTSSYVSGYYPNIQIRVGLAFDAVVTISATVTYSPSGLTYPTRTITLSPVTPTVIPVPSYSIADNPTVQYTGDTYNAADLVWQNYDPTQVSIFTSTGTTPGTYTAAFMTKYGYTFASSTLATATWTIPPKAITVTALVNGNTTALSPYGSTDIILDYTLSDAFIDSYSVVYDGNGIQNITPANIAVWIPNTYSISPRVVLNSNVSSYYNITAVSASLQIVRSNINLQWTNPGTNLVVGNTGTCTVSPTGMTVTYTSSNTNIVQISNNTYTAVAPGNVTLTATMPATTTYNEATATLDITVDALPRPVYTMPSVSSSTMYNGANQQAIAAPGTVITSGATMYYYVHPTVNPTTAGVTGRTNYAYYKFSAAASYKVWYRITETATTSAVPWTQFGTFIIMPASNTPTWTNPSNNSTIAIGTGRLEATAPFSDVTYSTTASSSILTISGDEYTALAISTNVPLIATTTTTQNWTGGTATIYVNIDQLPTVTEPTLNTATTYDGQGHAPFATNGSVTHGTMYYAIRTTKPIGFKDVPPVDVSNQPTSVRLTSAKTYPIWIGVKGDDGYQDIPWHTIGEFTINRANNIIMADTIGTVSADNQWHNITNSSQAQVGVSTQFPTICTMTSSDESKVQVRGLSYRPIAATGANDVTLTITSWATNDYNSATKTLTVRVT